MLAHEAHWLGEPCWHVCQYYDLLRARHKARALKRLQPKPPSQVWHGIKQRERRETVRDMVNVFGSHKRY